VKQRSHAVAATASWAGLKSSTSEGAFGSGSKDRRMSVRAERDATMISLAMNGLSEPWDRSCSAVLLSQARYRA
jgi:hypothetical protein